LTGSEILARAFGAFRRALGQQPLVDIALDVGLHRRPCLGADQIHDQPPQRRRVLDLLPSLLEDRAQHPRLLAQFFQDVPVMHLQFVAVPLQQAGPPQFRRHDRPAVVRRPVSSSAIFRNSRNVICSVYAMYDSPSSRKTWAKFQALLTICWVGLLMQSGKILIRHIRQDFVEFVPDCLD
jgi:hypothetical protein